MTKPLNIGLIGYGFMGRAHSNAYSRVNPARAEGDLCPQ
jgi:hypothetical protein